MEDILVNYHLHYMMKIHCFLPLFIPLKKGDCVNIEAFSSPDNGTIVRL